MIKPGPHILITEAGSVLAGLVFRRSRFSYQHPGELIFSGVTSEPFSGSVTRIEKPVSEIAGHWQRYDVIGRTLDDAQDTEATLPPPFDLEELHPAETVPEVAA